MCFCYNEKKVYLCIFNRERKYRNRGVERVSDAKNRPDWTNIGKWL